jgi:phosphate starvation-inducible PhoH-like protein
VPEVQTLQFENGRVLQSLYANDLKLLKSVEDALLVKVTTREGWLRVEGEPEGIDGVKRLFEQLDRARKSGVTIHKHEFNYALRSIKASDGESLDELSGTRLNVSTRRGPIVPKTPRQREYIKAIGTTDMVFGVGPAGTGKTYLAMAMAVAALKQEQVARIVLTRPAVEAGERLGFLPGDMLQKVDPYLRPLYDALYDMVEPEAVVRLMERGTIEVAPLAYMRGRTLNDSFIILDEAQNTTPEQMKMFLTRLGFGSKVVVTGDVTQIDLPEGRGRSGLMQVRGVLEEIDGLVFVELGSRDVVRHRIVQDIVDAYERHEG